MGVLDGLLDASIAFSFDRSGYRRHARTFRAQDLDTDLRGRVALITGANAGLGRATAIGLASRGADVVLLCRSAERGRVAAEEVGARARGGKVSLERLDVSELASVRDLVGRWRRRRVDVLVHNAGVLPDERLETSDGHELTLATHVVGPFLFTQRLLPRLRHAGGRVVFVSSGGMYAKRLDLDDIQWKGRRYDGVAAYAQTKRAQVVLAELMAERLAGTGVSVNAMHPGWADTRSVRESLPGFWRRMQGRLRTADEGADTIIWLAACERLAGESGGFWFDRRRVSTHLLPWTGESRAERARLWETCEELSGARFD